MWVTPDQSRESVVDLYHRAWAHAAETFAACELDTVGHVPHWGGEAVTLHQILVHVATETTATPVMPTSCARWSTGPPAS